VSGLPIAVVLEGMDLTDAQWAMLEPMFRPRRRPDGRGRPWTDSRRVLDAVLWILRTGAPWADLPGRYPPYQTCHRRFQLWQRSGRLDRLLQRLAEDLRDLGNIDLSDAYVDATFASAKKGALRISQTRLRAGENFQPSSGMRAATLTRRHRRARQDGFRKPFLTEIGAVAVGDLSA
jgi:transposase